MVCKIIFCSEFPDIPDKAGRETRRRRRIQAIAKLYAFHANATRSSGTTSVCFSVETVNDEYRKPEFNIKRRG